MPDYILGANGQIIKATKEGELWVHSRNSEEMLYANQHDGQAWVMGWDAFDPDATDKIFGYIKNGSNDVDIHVRHFAFETTVAGFLEIIRVTGTATSGTPVVLVAENENFSANTPDGIFEDGTDIGGLTDGGKHDWMYLETGKMNRLTVHHDIILGKNGAIALNWVPSTGILTGTVKFYTHAPREEQMALTVVIRGANGKLVEVSESGELVMGPLHYSDPIFNLLDVNDQVYNFFRPKAGQQLIITGIDASANRNVTTQTQLDIYEATSSSSGTISKQIRRWDIPKNGEKQAQGIFEIIRPGAFINAKCDDDDVLLTISGYYIPELSDAVGIPL